MTFSTPSGSTRPTTINSTIYHFIHACGHVKKEIESSFVGPQDTVTWRVEEFNRPFRCAACTKKFRAGKEGKKWWQFWKRAPTQSELLSDAVNKPWRFDNSFAHA